MCDGVKGAGAGAGSAPAVKAAAPAAGAAAAPAAGGVQADKSSDTLSVLLAQFSEMLKQQNVKING